MSRDRGSPWGAKLVAGLLVLLCESRSKNETRSRALLFLEYASYLNNYNYDLMGLAVMSCSYAMTSPGFSWSMTENAGGIDMLTYKMLNNASLTKIRNLSRYSLTEEVQCQLPKGFSGSLLPNLGKNT